MKFKFYETLNAEFNTSDQEFTSKETANGNASANKGKGRIPALFKKIKLIQNSLLFDYGCGKATTQARIEEFLEPYNIRYVGFDKYNQSKAEQDEAIKIIRENDGADIATCANVLNVIKERNIRVNEVIQNIYNFLKQNGTAYFDVYADKKQTNAKQTGSDKWQEFRAIDTYMDEVAEVFGADNVALTKGIIVATKKR